MELLAPAGAGQISLPASSDKLPMPKLEYSPVELRKAFCILRAHSAFSNQLARLCLEFDPGATFVVRCDGRLLENFE